MKAPAKIAIFFLVLASVAWIATHYLGPAKLTAQFAAKQRIESRSWDMIKADPAPPGSGTAIMTVQSSHTLAPLYFEAQTSVRGSFGHWGAANSYRRENVARDEWGHDDTAAYFYTPWRVYQLKISQHTEFYNKGISPLEKALQEAERERRVREMAERETALKRPEAHENQRK